MLKFSRVMNVLFQTLVSLKVRQIANESVEN